MSQVDLDAVKNEARRRVHNLVEDYMHVLAAGRKESFNEERVKIAYIVPFLEALQWNPRTDEVLPEQATLTGRADFGLRVGGRTKIFVEMKSFNKSLDGYDTVKGSRRSYAEQAIQYAWGMKADWAVLTNFEEIRLYDSHVKKPEDGLVWKKPIRFTEYESRFDEIWLISKESIVSGALDAYRAKVERPPVDEAFLGDLMNCRQLLAEDIKKNNPGLTYDLIGESVQKILDRLIFIKNCEDRLIIPAESLWKRFKAWEETAIDKDIVIFMMDLKNLFRYFDQVYNGKLFEKHPCEDLKISNQVLEEIIDTLYGDGQHLGYNFSVIPVDVLGQAYELYISSIIKEKEGQAKAIEIVKQPAKRKAYGIYYTPEYVVDFIVRNNLAEVLNKCKTPEDVSKIKVLDPACGSGSFLIKAFDVINEWYANYNKQKQQLTTHNTLDAHLVSIPNVEERILTENLYGVDLDPQAVEITILNLSLKAVKTREKLPYMGDHIKFGNSLISGSEAELKRYFEDPEEMRPFDWEREFPNIFQDGGFDVVIGNPPYVSYSAKGGTPMSDNEFMFFRESYDFLRTKKKPRLNSLMFFIEKGLSLLKTNGTLGFIVNQALLYVGTFDLIRKYILSTCAIEAIVTDVPFEGVIADTCIIILKKGKAKEDHKFKWIPNIQQPEIYYLIPQVEPLKNKRFEFVLSKCLPILTKIERNTEFLDDVAIVRRGMQITKEDFLSDTKIDDRYHPCLSNDNIFRYGLVYPSKAQEDPKKGRKKFVIFDKDLERQVNEKLAKSGSTTRVGIGESGERFEKPKIVVRQAPPHPMLCATYDEERFYTDYTLHIINHKKYPLKYLLGIINSKLMTFYAIEKEIVYTGPKRVPQLMVKKLKLLPIKEASKEAQQTISELVDTMLLLNKQSKQISPDFERYLTEPIIAHIDFRQYYNRLAINEKSAVDKTSFGMIKKLKVKELDNWLVFNVNFVTKEKEEKEVEVLRCQFKDEGLRKFLLNTINNYKKTLGTGNLLHKILAIEIPCFDKDYDKNNQIIDRLMREYLKSISERSQFEKQIRDIDDQIDKKIYDLYGISEDEIPIIESSR